MKESLDKNFLEPFRKAIDLSKAHYELELKQVLKNCFKVKLKNILQSLIKRNSLTNGMQKSLTAFMIQVKSGERDPKRPEISMEVEGESSSNQNMAPEQEVDCLNSAIANFDMMNSVLVIVDDLLQRSQKEISKNR